MDIGGHWAMGIQYTVKLCGFTGFMIIKPAVHASKCVLNSNVCYT
jgi:hypothetical protein